jgi:hypothetical protein
MKREFWQGLCEGLNPMWGTAWLLYGIGHLFCLIGNRYHVPGMYGPYNRLMLWSLAICERFRFSSPWECRE